jgi:hypothetical protein
MKYIIHPNNSGITFFHNNSPFRVYQSDVKYPEALAIFDLPVEEQDSALDTFIRGPVLPTSEKAAENAGFIINGDNVSYKGENLPQVLAKKVIAFVEQNLPIDLFLKFWENLRQNLSYTAILELYDFLAYKDLPLTEDGYFIGYKGVGSDFFSIMGNLETRVLQGTTNDRGQIKNVIGERIEVDRRDVCDDRRIACAPGLHVGSLDYAKGWGSKVIIVKVHPKDVVSIPCDSGYQKCRCSAYEVLAEYKEEILAPVVDENLEPIYDEDLVAAKAVEEERIAAATAVYDEVTTKVKAYLQRKKDAGVDFVTTRQIQNSFSPSYPSRERILDALNTLGYTFYLEDGSYYVNIA